MRDQLKRVAEEDKQRTWFNEGVAQFNEILRQNNDNVDILASEIIKHKPFGTASYPSISNTVLKGKGWWWRNNG
jgi:hypothetical protein